MREIKFRFRLKLKIDVFGSYVKNEIHTFYIDLLDDKNGLISYPINLEIWEIVSCDQFIGLVDKSRKYIYEGDILFHEYHDRKTIIKWVDDYACFAGETVDEIIEEEYNFYQKIDESKLEIIGNIYEI